ncbi:MAG: hypothetical protein AAF789_15345 [Bacteroidota bacterium]
MNVQEAKLKIIDLLDKIPSESIPGLLGYVEALNRLHTLDQSIAVDLEKIMEEDDDLLKELAK